MSNHNNTDHQFSDDDFSWAETDDAQYKSRTEKTRDVLVPEGKVPFRVRVMKPTRLMGFLEEYGLKDVSERVDDNTTLADPQDADAEQSLEFIHDVLFPNIVKPDAIYYEEGETEQESRERPGFNFVDLSRTDLEVLIGVMTDTPAEKAIEMVESGEGSIAVTDGGDGGMPGFRDGKEDDYQGRFR